VPLRVYANLVLSYLELFEDTPGNALPRTVLVVVIAISLSLEI
jgi:hypothetical protein